MIYYCPLAFSRDCSKEKCQLHGTSRCVDGQLQVNISDRDRGRAVSCPRFAGPNCNSDDCSLWGTPQCDNGFVKIYMHL